ncbi:hypothetical protein AAVH_04175 [Aphelenchoides avenae]|nr:hypothetical protein AAVH_04175 [Aphelenchus avenae]
MADHSAKGRRKKKHNDEPKADDSAKQRKKKHSGEGRPDMSAKSSKKTKKKKGLKPVGVGL